MLSIDTRALASKLVKKMMGSIKTGDQIS